MSGQRLEMDKPLRIIDTGLRTGRKNIAFDAAMLSARQGNLCPNTLRFIHFKPVALVGRHQDVSQEIKVDECIKNGVEIGRRITGGGAIYFDEGQIGWALVCDKATLGTNNLSEITQKICEAAALGLRKLGVNARFRPRNDIEIDGKKISGTGGFFDGDILMYQGTVLIDLDPLKMVSALNVPAHKLSHQNEVSMAARVTSLKQELGYVPSKEEIKSALVSGFVEHLGFSPNFEAPNAQEEEIAKSEYENEIGTDDFVFGLNNLGRDDAVFHGMATSAGGVVNAYLRKEGPMNERIREVIFTGDFFIAPPRIVFDLEASLRNTLLSDVDKNIKLFFDISGNNGLLSISPSQFVEAINSAISA